ALVHLLDTGAVKKPAQSLSELMHDLFEDAIRDEKNAIANIDAETSGELEKLERAREEEHRSSPRLTRRRSSERLAEPVSAEYRVSSMSAYHSRVPFLLLLAAIGLATGVLSVVANKVGHRQAAAGELPSAASL